MRRKWYLVYEKPKTEKHQWSRTKWGTFKSKVVAENFMKKLMIRLPEDYFYKYFSTVLE